MAAPNMNGRLHLTDVHQNSPASFEIAPNPGDTAPDPGCTNPKSCGAQELRIKAHIFANHSIIAVIVCN